MACQAVPREHSWRQPSHRVGPLLTGQLLLPGLFYLYPSLWELVIKGQCQGRSLSQGAEMMATILSQTLGGNQGLAPFGQWLRFSSLRGGHRL